MAAPIKREAAKRRKAIQIHFATRFKKTLFETSGCWCCSKIPKNFLLIGHFSLCFSLAFSIIFEKFFNMVPLYFIRPKFPIQPPVDCNKSNTQHPRQFGL